MPKMLLSDCRRCHLSENRIGNVIKGKGSRQASLMMIGGAPNIDELNFEHVLDHWVKLFNKIQIWVTHVCKCNTPNNRNLSELEIDACYPWLRKELIIIRPGVVVTLGSDALFAMTGMTSVENNRGRFLFLPELIPPVDGGSRTGLYLLSTYAPWEGKYEQAEQDFQILQSWYFDRQLPEVKIVDSRIWR